MTWSGVCLRAIVSVIPPVSIVGHEYSQSHWTTFRGPNHHGLGTVTSGIGQD